jgi:hypothetical protein
MLAKRSGAPPAWLALWNDVADGFEEEYEAWHGGEHVPERLTVAGIELALRYVAGSPPSAPRYFTWYALRGLDVLESAPYRYVVEHPSPWSRRMRPRLGNLRRLACRTLCATAAQPAERIVAALLERRPGLAPGIAAGSLLGEVAAEVRPLEWVKSGGADPAARFVLLAPPVAGETAMPYRLIGAYTAHRPS